VHDGHVEQPHVPAKALHANGLNPEQLQPQPGTQQKTPFITLINLMCLMAMWNSPLAPEDTLYSHGLDPEQLHENDVKLS
jgi:hypothetical protein